MTTLDRAPELAAAPLPGRVLAAVAPLIVVGVGFVLWWISDQLVQVGPLDRATFGWLFVIPLWALAPLVAGVAWQRLSPRATWLAAIVAGLAVGGPMAFFLWQSAAFPACPTGQARTPTELLGPAIMLGVVLGGAFGLVSQFASTLVREGHRWFALVVGAMAQLALIPVGGFLMFVLFFGICQRP